MSKALKSLGKVAVVLLVATAFLTAVVPLGLYWLGLSNIQGRPKPPRILGNVTADRALLEQDLRMREPIVVEVLNPWSFFWTSFRLDEKSRSDRAAGMVAGYYISDHLRSHRMLWWHFSEASLMIWVTRHWTADEIITAAAARARAQPNPSAHK